MASTDDETISSQTKDPSFGNRISEGWAEIKVEENPGWVWRLSCWDLLLYNRDRKSSVLTSCSSLLYPLYCSATQLFTSLNIVVRVWGVMTCLLMSMGAGAVVLVLGLSQTGNELVGKDVSVFASPLLQKGVDLEILRTTTSVGF